MKPGMRINTFIFLLLAYIPTVKSQQIQPSYLGEASWHKVSGQQAREPLSVTSKSYPITKVTTKDSPITMVQERIDPKTITLHNGPTLPVIQQIRITGKKLLAPQVFPAPHLEIRESAGFNVSYTDKRHGFAGTYTTDFAEDDAHNIWMATENGLIRYDGNQYYVYNQTNGLPDMPESSIVFDQQKRLWLVSDNGAYFIRNDSLFSIRSPEIDFSALACIKVQTDLLQRVWISSKLNGVICIEGSTIKVFDKRCGLPGNYFTSVYLDKKGNLFLASGNHGILLIEPKRMRMFFSGSKKMQFPAFLSLYEDEDGIWAGSFLNGMIRMGSKDTIRYSINGKFNERIFDIKKAPGGIWISCFSQALCYFNKKQLLIINDKNGLVNNFPYRIFEDGFNNLWVSSGISGFSRINENSFYLQNYSNPVIGFEKTVIPDHKKGNWILTYGKGLIYQKGNVATTYQIKKLENLTKHINDGVLNNDGSLWIGSYGEGMISVTEKTFTSFKYSSLADHGIVVAIKKDTTNKVWFCPTRYGLILYDNNKFWRYTEKSGLLTNNVTNLFQDAGKMLHWTFSEGFQRFNGPVMETFYIGNKQFKDQVNGMLGLDRETDLLATTISGLLLIHKGKVYQFTSANGFTSNSIKTIIRDGTGNIWISTNNGIESFRLDGISVTDHHIYTESNGPYVMDINGVRLDSTGLPYWSERENKLVFNPAFLNTSKRTPVFSFDRIEANNHIFFLNEQISILPDQKITIDYKTIYWGRENNLKLTYQLISDHEDTTMRSVQNNGSIIISDILPGNYRIFLKANDNNEIFYSNPINITVRNFWYNTWAFRIIMGVLIISGIIFYFRQKAKRQLMVNELLKTKVREQTEIIEKEKEALLLSNQTINLQNKEKDILIDEVNHRVKNNLQFIAAMVEMQMNNQYSNEAIQALLGTSRRIKAMSLVHELLNNRQEQKGLSMKNYIQELVDNLKEMANDDNNPVKIVMDVDDLVMDSKTALSLGMIISELVSNSFKHAFKDIERPEILIHLKNDKTASLFMLTVSDNGKGYQQPRESTNGLGSRLVDIFSRQLEGQYTLETDGHFTYKLQFKTIET